MKIELDQESLRTMLHMWRKAVDLQIPLRSDIRTHFLSSRGDLLKGFVELAGNWLTVLHSCKATGPDLIELEQLVTDIEDFKQWAEIGIAEMALLKAEEQQPPAQ